MTGAGLRPECPIEHLEATAYKIPTDLPESDGTLQWDSTTLVIVEVSAGGKRGLGYTYANIADAMLIHEKLEQVVMGKAAMDVPRVWTAINHLIRNLGRPGLVSCALSAIDVALWDLKAKLLDVPLVTLLGPVRDGVPVYGSGGFTSYTEKQLQEQLGGWAEQGIPRVKMKIGREPQADPQRVRAARQAIGDKTQLFVDANGAYRRKQALEMAFKFKEYDVVWFEEPVTSDDLDGLRLLRNHGPAGMEIAAGEYGYESYYFESMLQADAVDVLQADGSRCGGITGFMRVDPLCEVHDVPLSAHTAPSLHAHAACCLPTLIHLEYFHDHVRIEHMFFDGALSPRDGSLYPDLSRPGLGLELKRADAKRYLVWSKS